MLFNSAGELALIRNTYGWSDHLVLPGGGIRLFEEPSAAAKREVKEELGVDLAELNFRSRHWSSAEGKRDEIYLFEARTDGELTCDELEVEEAQFASLDKLPSRISPATMRRIDEFLGRRAPDGNW